MSVPELLKWHERAVARAGRES
ncbi:MULTISPECIES: GpE family phage tail protein [Photorhabdus]|nr:GpE family phage tail protein [Photorhabdus laumondii]